MNEKTIYSVVDLEATGTDAAAGDRIIQFSCTFVQDQRILDSFSTLINPLQPIDERITQLTGITDEMVADAPTFRDVASLLYNMLQNTVFVAHNVNFDFPFINHEFERMDHATLPIKAIDTVTMSQILLPTLPSYQLRRISSYFNIVHKHPHSASSDAYATAYLLILLIDRLNRLPYDTLRGILRIHPRLPQNTMEMFSDALQRAKAKHRALPSFLRIKRGLVLRRSYYPNRRHWKTFYKYPVSRTGKLKLYKSQLKWFPKQAQMMNRIYRNYTKKGSRANNWLFEAATGMGRKVAYTLPMAYLSHDHRQTVIISTASRLLRKQLNDQTIPTLDALLPFNISSLIIKDTSNYIDLNRFFNTLRVHEKSNQTQLTKAMVLVWLTITKTGDLNELHINPRIPYLKEIRHYQDNTQRRHNPFYYQDFIRQQQITSHRVNFIIVSQKYLCRHAKELSHLSSRPYLVVDEASKLPEAELSQYRFKLNLNLMNIMVRRIMSDLYRTHSRNLRDILPRRFKVTIRLKHLRSALDTIDRAYHQITHRFSRTFLQRRLLQPFGKQMAGRVSVKKLQRFFNDENPNFQVINQGVKKIDKVTHYFQSLSVKRSYRRINRLEMDNYYHHVAIMNDFKNAFNTLISQVQMQPDNCTFLAMTNEPHNVACCDLIGGLINVGDHLKTDLYQYFRPIIFTDHALISNQSRFAKSRLKLSTSNTRQGSDLSTISRSKPAIDVYQTLSPLEDRDAYCNELAKLLLQKGAKRPQRLLVGFASRSLMSKTFYILTAADQLHEPVYAEAINGSQKRILKRLTNAQNAIVLTGLDWFNELNLAFPKRFGQLIIADLPFKLDGNIYQRARLARMKSNHKLIIKRIQLPEIILTIKRILNYLPNHRDRVLIFDGRLLNKRYLIPLIKSLPKGVVINPRKIKIDD